MGKKRVAILGGGCASMAAAYYLSNTAELRDAIDVTVYQLGWRLGGKGASGRNHAIGDRIEEHGLHVWGGFYYNAFRMIQACYGALQRPSSCPLRTWDQAFEKHDFVAWEEWIDGQWKTWPLHPRDDDEIPGQCRVHPGILTGLARIIGMIADAIENWPNDQVRAMAQMSHAPHTHIQELEESAPIIEAAGGAFDGSPLSTLRSAELLAGSLLQMEDFSADKTGSIALLLLNFRAWLREVENRILEDNRIRRLFIMVDLGLTLGIGIVKDGLWSRGYMAIDNEDFRQWLARHGALQIALDSATLRGYYDYFFAYEGGDFNSPRMSAGMGAHHIVRLAGDYKGALFWKMKSGMGDAVFAPLYEICKKNGVRFEFFHRVDKLIPSSAGDTIESVSIKRQVRLKNGDYDPLVYPRNVPSWPSEPLYDQIDPRDVAELQRRHANLEDPWTDWDDVETIVLRSGVDFDAIVLGISIGALRDICEPLVNQKPDWAAMVRMLPAIQTQAMQLWFNDTVAQLGWNGGQGGNATGTAYANPHQSWSDMSQVIELENWPGGKAPQSVVYFCGPMKTQPMPQGKDPAFGQQETAKATTDALSWTLANLAHLYPNIVQNGNFDWNALFDSNAQTGDKRFDAQYVRANYTPSERYVVDLPGTAKYRLDADTSGYDNLALAGDWIFTGLGGAVESAVIGGMLAARGLAGKISDPIVDETPNPWRRKASLKKILG